MISSLPLPAMMCSGPHSQILGQYLTQLSLLRVYIQVVELMVAERFSHLGRRAIWVFVTGKPYHLVRWYSRPLGQHLRWVYSLVHL